MNNHIENKAAIVALFGKRVRVTLCYGDNSSPAVISTGIFLGFRQDGAVEILEDDYVVHYCWPLLDIEGVNDER